MAYIIDALHGREREESKKEEFKHLFDTKSGNMPRGITIND